MEVLITAAVIWLIYYIVKTVMATTRRRGKWKILGKRLLPFFVAALYIWSLFCWLWNSGYHAPGFAQKNGFTGEAVNAENLIAVTLFFADGANERSLLVPRDADGSYIENRREMFAASVYVYQGIAEEFPSLGGRLFRPKPMVFSWLMSRTGYSGMYFALTGESNINTGPPGIMMPATVAHEHAHQLGVFAEEEANFVGILASMKSGNVIFEYAGYLKGLSYLLNALAFTDARIWHEVWEGLADEVKRDFNEISEFWQSQRTVNIGFDFIDNILTTLTRTVRETVDTIYDGYLRANDQVLGIRSYGACVDLIIEYFITRGFVEVNSPE
jgi:hypothetical protein